MTEANAEDKTDQFALELEIAPRTHQQRMELVRGKLGLHASNDPRPPQSDAAGQDGQ